jgi:hypothetical protein
MQFMAWFGAGEMVKVPLHADRFLIMMSELAVGWLLLDQAAIALEKLPGVSADHPDHAYYAGKRHVAVYFAQQVLPGVVSSGRTLLAGDQSAWEIPAEAFATV